MVQKTTLAVPADKSGILKINIFHLYGGRKKTGLLGCFLQVSVREILPKMNMLLKRKFIAILIRSAYRYRRNDGTTVMSDNNYVVLLKKRMTPLGKEIHGPVYRTIRRRRFISSFPGII